MTGLAVPARVSALPDPLSLADPLSLPDLLSLADLPAVAPVLLVVGAVLLWPEHTPWAAPIRRNRYTRTARSQPAAVAEALDLLALALRGGADVQRAVRQVAETMGGTAGRELQAVAAALAWGLEEDVAWQHAPTRWRPAARALALAAHAGIPPADLLGAAAADLRRDAAADVDVATASLAVRLVLPLGLAFLPAFVLTTVVPVVVALAGGLVSPP